MESIALRLTRFTALKPAHLSKRFALAGDTLVKESGGNLQDGIAERLTIPDLAAFAALLPMLTPKQALSFGINGHDRARVIPKDAPPPVGDDLPIISRTREHFKWPKGAGIFMLDYDPAPDGPPLDMEALRATLAAACPALAAAPAVWRPSASSCIHDAKTGAELRGINGQRLYVPVLDAADIPRALQVLVDRLWLAGLGRWQLSKSGAWLARTVVDASVAQPERLDFCGGADCGKGLQQRLPDPILFNETASYLDTRAALPDLDAAERHRLVELRERLKKPLKERQRQTREAWIDERVKAGLGKLPEADREQARPRLEQTYCQAAEGGRLTEDFELTVVRKGTRTRKVMTVGALLKDRAQYHEATTLDPLEPDYPDGQARLVGWVNLRAREPYLQRQAHGGTRYVLVGEPKANQPPPMDEEKSDPRIAVAKGAIAPMLAAAEQALIERCPDLYQRAGMLTRTTRIAQDLLEHGFKRPAGCLTLLPVTADFLLWRMNQLIQWEKHGPDGVRPADAPRALAGMLLDLAGHWRFPYLNGVIECPTLRADGTVLIKEGYDQTSGLYLDSGGMEFDPIPDRPTKAQAQRALDDLRDVLKDFPYEADQDRAVTVSGILTVPVRHGLNTAPLHAHSATRPGSGKSLQVDIAALIATGRTAPAMSQATDETEEEKRLVGILLSGTPLALIDNVNRPLGSDRFCSVLTQQTYKGRVLGLNKNPELPCRLTWFATGNALTLMDDMNDRAIMGFLNPATERPEQQAFDRDLYQWIPERRHRLASAVKTVLRHYVVMDFPDQKLTPFVRFNDWSRLVRGALVYLGEADPVLTQERLRDRDPVRTGLGALLEAWHEEFKDKAMLVNEVAATESREL